jgi:hypothetical protein
LPSRQSNLNAVRARSGFFLLPARPVSTATRAEAAFYETGRHLSVRQRERNLRHDFRRASFAIPWRGAPAFDAQGPSGGSLCRQRAAHSHLPDRHQHLSTGRAAAVEAAERARKIFKDVPGSITNPRQRQSSRRAGSLDVEPRQAGPPAGGARTFGPPRSVGRRLPRMSIPILRQDQAACRSSARRNAHRFSVRPGDQCYDFLRRKPR